MRDRHATEIVNGRHGLKANRRQGGGTHFPATYFIGGVDQMFHFRRTVMRRDSTGFMT